MHSTAPGIYCLDSNVLIQAWQKYYSPQYCPTYWDVLNQLGAEKRIFVPDLVFKEITRTDDGLSDWLKTSDIAVSPITASVTTALRSIYETDPNHKHLVDARRGRSLADPWVIAHAIDQNATVVTKEELITAANKKRIKIPNVCDNMDVRWINDFEMIAELGLTFSCER